MNKDEALRCFEISKQVFAAGDRSKAIKFAQKSLSLYPSKDVEAWLEKIQQSSGSSTNTSNSTTEREYTKEQVEAVEKIRSCKNDYYSVLGVSRDCTEADLKKAYRKLALQFHPDKNSAPGASEAFKAIGEAFTTLSDPQKKEAYDQFDVAGLRGASNPSGGSRAGFQGQTEMTPEELFNLFFGELARTQPGPGFRTASFQFGTPPRMRRPQRRRQEEHHSSGYLALFVQLLPFLLVILMNYMTSYSRDPSYSFVKTAKHTEKHETAYRQISYYIAPADYIYYFDKNPREKYRFEEGVEITYINSLQQQCQAETYDKQQRISKARWWGTAEDLERANSQVLFSCEQLHKLTSTK